LYTSCTVLLVLPLAVPADRSIRMLRPGSLAVARARFLVKSCDVYRNPSSGAHNRLRLSSTRVTSASAWFSSANAGFSARVWGSNRESHQKFKSSSRMAQGLSVEASASTEYQIVLVQNETLVECSENSGDWLSNAPRGAYTTGRTVGRDAVFEFDFHVRRLATSIKLMLEADHPGAPFPAHLAPLLEEGLLRPKVLSSLRAGMRAFQAPGEVKLTVLITWDDEKFDIFSHLVPLPDRPVPPVKVMVKGNPRSNAAAKDSDWVRARKTLEDDKPKDVNEIVLMQDDGGLFEGMSSNFFVVTKDGTLITAGDGILAGTVREVLLQVCQREGVPVRLEAPLLGDIDSWEGCMVSSTSRLALPIDEFTFPTDEGPKSMSFSEAPLTKRLAALVQESIAENSTKVFEA